MAACGCCRRKWQANKHPGDGGESHMDLIDHSGCVMQTDEFLSAWFAGRSDLAEQWLVDELMVSDGDEQGSSSNSGCRGRTNVAVFSAEPGIDQRRGDVQSEAAPAVEVVEGKADGGQLVADGGVKSRVHLFGDTGNHKQHRSADPGTGRESCDSEADLLEKGRGGFGQGFAPVI